MTGPRDLPPLEQAEPSVLVSVGIWAVGVLGAGTAALLVLGLVVIS